VAPLLNPNYLTVQSDFDILIGAFKRIRQFWGTRVMQSLAIGDEFRPGKKVITDVDIEHFIRQNFNTI
jgi:choline dehydrogenase